IARVLAKHGDDRYIRGAAVCGLAGREVPTLELFVRRPDRSADDSRKAVVTELVDCALRESEESRSGLADLVGELAAQQDPAAVTILDRVRRAQRLDTDDPRPLKL